MQKLVPLFPFLLTAIMTLYSYGQDKQRSFHPATSRSAEIKKWEDLKFGAFVHFNDNTFMGTEFSKNTDPDVFNPEKLDMDGMVEAFKEAGVSYAVLTARHTSGFCLWNSKTTSFDVESGKTGVDVVGEFVNACRKYEVKPCFYYCLWGGKWKPWDWN